MAKFLPILFTLVLILNQARADFKDFLLQASSLSNMWTKGFQLSDLSIKQSTDFEDPEYIDFSVDKFVETNKNLQTTILDKDGSIKISLEFIFLKDIVLEKYAVYTYYKTFGNYM